ncbi:MAG: hypothetical protein EZS28_002426 [Streblomastix strix]|uniref:Uncharacterized protein n=1 Tax=Streblomastix strix TaxID=222440 RepID=A0A5J4X600_9EUKA|nr:MAG: hypothetical protein EZS28_002426 [Streblomastix strix]
MFLYRIYYYLIVILKETDCNKGKEKEFYGDDEFEEEGQSQIWGGVGENGLGSGAFQLGIFVQEGNEFAEDQSLIREEDQFYEIEEGELGEEDEELGQGFEDQDVIVLLVFQCVGVVPDVP